MTDPTIAKVLTSVLPTVDLCDLTFDDHFVPVSYTHLCR